MIIGFIGLGMVGKAMFDVFSEYYEAVFYDIKIFGSKINDVLKANIIFIAVPTKINDDNSCDLTILNQILEELHNLNYDGVICIKSTIIPETTIGYINKYANNKICFCPEFLRERCAYDDFKYRNKLIIIGTVCSSVFEIVVNIHKCICNNFKQVHPTEAEFTKYFHNVYNTTRILFANAFYEVCKNNDVVYDNIIDTLVEKGEIDDKYLRCNEKLRGPSGPCLVKDTLAFNEYVKKINKRICIFQSLVDDIKLYPKTVIAGTRTELEYFGKNI